MIYLLCGSGRQVIIYFLSCGKRLDHSTSIPEELEKQKEIKQVKLSGGGMGLTGLGG